LFDHAVRLYEQFVAVAAKWLTGNRSVWRDNAGVDSE